MERGIRLESMALDVSIENSRDCSKLPEGLSVPLVRFDVKGGAARTMLELWLWSFADELA